MCGIAGIIAPAGATPGRETLAAMASAIAHRGPDGEGFFTRGRAGLAHRRLAIIDLATGDQPMCNEDGSLWIVFNGEIYNHLDLRRDLEAKGHRFATASDTEAILHAFEEYGPACVERLRGMFAFAVWDERGQSLFAARDRLGKKPFYYCLHQGHLLFASEPASLLAFPGVSREPDLEALGLYLSLQYVPDPLCAFKALRKLPPAHHLAWKDGRLDTARYWSLAFEPKFTAGEDQLAEELRERLTEATRIRLMSDVPLGAHLSGGIDSSIVVALMSRLSDEPVKTFSIGFAEAAFSELHKARAMAARYGTDHSEFMVEYGHVPSTLEQVVAHVGEPFADPSALPSYFLARETRTKVTVALNGDGGDELFAGYQRYWLDPLVAPYAALPRFVTQGLVPALLAAWPQAGDRPIESDWVAGLKRLAQVAAISPKASIVRWGSYFTPEAAGRLWRPEVRPSVDALDLLARLFDGARANTFLDRTLATDLGSYLPGDLLVKADRMAMAHGLEGRSPLLDHELAEWAARLPARLKMRGRTGKYLLRKAFADLLPPEVTAQGKQGFGIPVGKWMREGLSGWSRELLLGGVAVARLFRREEIARLLDEHARGRIDHGKRLWALACLELWLRRFSAL
ncbi:asparagine synthase (glutamine-hydrolyzing) [Fundidesulfovibrio terrae]|uniref:asparagine synthase (glutamine-hydrolyzing) n=1 Tax=Fundidesulfovibrio terrae TaxID=2922866 RepID=UPI001FAE88F6|nr:asparagine synthase (glutamine-hydrolyzing) [Fundidesulfovibrio terrae]